MKVMLRRTRSRRWPPLVVALSLVSTAAFSQPGDPSSVPSSTLEEGPVVALPPDAQPATGEQFEQRATSSDELRNGEMASSEVSEVEGAADVVDLPTLFGEAVGHYQEGRYRQAVAAFERFLRIGPDNASAHYNLGNALLLDGQLGRAIASYRRASHLAPRDEDVRANLQFARTSARDALAVPDAGPVPRTLFFWHFSFSSVERVWLAVTCNVLFWLGLAWMRLQQRRPGRGGFGLAVTSGVLLVALAGSLAYEWWRGERVVVVLPAEVDVHAAPRSESVVRFKLHAGSEVRLADEESGWVLIELPDGERGWLETTFVERTP